MSQRPTVLLRVRGMLLLELALALVIVGGLVAALLPLFALQNSQQSEQQDVAVLEQAKQALLGRLLTANGLPAPIKFAESDIGTGQTASSHVELDSALTPLGLAWPGALPGTELGVPTVSSLQTAYWYDAHPALRADADASFVPATVSSTVGSDTFYAFRPIKEQLDLAINTKLSTGGNRSQLCRHVNTLQTLDTRMRAYTSGATSEYDWSLIDLTWPRVWATGLDDRFSWDPGLGYATVTPPASYTSALPNDQHSFDNSYAAAFVVARRNPPAQRRLDRQNIVYQQAGITGLDVPLASRTTILDNQGHRIYENPLTAARDNPASDTNDYAGRTAAASLDEVVSALARAGACSQPAETCTLNQLYVRFQNNVRSAPPSGDVTNLTLRWELVDALATVYQTGDVSAGTTTTGVCLDAFGIDNASSTSSRYLRVSFISPAGSTGYNPATNGIYWYRGGLLVDPNPNQSTADAGVNRWRPLSALSAAEGGKTVTVRCTGQHTVTAAGLAGELSPAGPLLPTCTVTQLP